MTFEVFRRGGYAKGGQPRVTLQRAGDFSFNVVAVQMLTGIGLHEPAAEYNVELLFDRANKAIGFRLVGESANAYTLRRTLGGNYMLAGRAFCKHYGLGVSEASRFVPVRETDKLVIYLDGPQSDVSRGKKGVRRGR